MDDERSRQLRERIVDHRLRCLANRPDAVIAHDTDDFRLELVLGLHVLTEDVLSWEVRLRKGLVDDGNGGAAGSVCLAELASFEQANTQRPEEIRADAVSGGTSTGDIGAAGGMKASQQRLAAERNEVRHARERHSRDLRDPLDQPLRECRARLSWILALVEAESRDDAMVEVETEIGMPDLDLAAHEEQRRHDQEQRHRQLADDKRLPYPHARRGALATLSHVVDNLR